MKKSIAARIFVYTAGIAVFVILLLQVMNAAFFEKYYIGVKRGQFEACIDNLEGIVSSQVGSDGMNSEIESIEDNTGLRIYIVDREYGIVYPQTYSRGMMMGRSGIAGMAAEIVEKMGDGEELFGTYEHPMLKAVFLTYARRLESGQIAIVQTPMGDISESVNAGRTFSVYVSAIALVAGIISSYLMARSMAWPIKEIGKVAAAVQNLQFGVRCKEDRRDEIGQLGRSINSMSSSLENTIKDLNTANEQLKAEVEKEKRIDRMRKDFISAVSHELKTPIALIQGYSEGLRDSVTQDEESRNFYCEVIQDEAVNMGNLVSELLELSRLESESVQIKLSKFNIYSLIKETARKSGIMTGEKNVAIETFKDGKDFEVMADIEKMERAIRNYVQNAIKNVGDKGSIKLTAYDLGEMTRISVYNSGSRIPQDEVDMIWNSFYKLDKARSRSEGGSGLGLSIVREIARLHFGSCGVLNREDGVEFWIEIPKNIE